MNINIIVIDDEQHVTLETKKGHRYYAIYAHPVTKDQVIEDFIDCKSSFYHVN